MSALASRGMLSDDYAGQARHFSGYFATVAHVEMEAEKEHIGKPDVGEPFSDDFNHRRPRHFRNYELELVREVGAGTIDVQGQPQLPQPPPASRARAKTSSRTVLLRLKPRRGGWRKGWR